MKRFLFLITLLTLLGGANSVKAENGTKTSFLLLKNGEINTTDFDVTPISPSKLTTENLYAATFTSKGGYCNIFKYGDLDVSGYDKIVIKYTIEDGQGDWMINLPDNSYPALPTGVDKEYVISLNGVSTYDDFTVFSWNHSGKSITISEVYGFKSEAESAVFDRLALTGMSGWGSIERTEEVKVGDDVMSATYDATAQYRDCISYSGLDVKDYDAIEIKLAEAMSGVWTVSYKVDGGGINYTGFGGKTTYLLSLAGVDELTELHVYSDKGADGTNIPSGDNHAGIKIASVKLIKYGLARLPLTGMSTWGSIERTEEVKVGDDVMSATYDATAQYRDCISYSGLDVKDYDAIKITLSEAMSGVWTVSYKVDGGGINYTGFGGKTTYLLSLAGVNELTELHVYSDKGADGTNIPSAENSAGIKIARVDLCSSKVTRSITVGADGYSTFSTDKPIDVDGVVTAYAAKYDGSKVALTPVTEIPANTGVIIEAAAGTYIVPAIESASAFDNDLKVSDGSITGDESTIYVLANGDKGPGFYLLKSGKTLKAGKAYLMIGGGARGFIGIDGMEPTGVNEVKVNKAVAKTGKIYNLNGQIVSKPTKGLYIIDGKVVSF